jgi:hypothetical protein
VIKSHIFKANNGFLSKKHPVFPKTPLKYRGKTLSKT